MTSRRPPVVSAPFPKPKSIPYPPASIWKTKEEGVSFPFRGNLFERRGSLVAHVSAVAAQGATGAQGGSAAQGASVAQGASAAQSASVAPKTGGKWAKTGGK